METRDNVGLILTINELINTPATNIVSKLKSFIDNIGYKKRRGEKNVFSQCDAWNIEVTFLQKYFSKSQLDRNTYILFEYMLPGENSERPDVLILFEDCVYSLEFKTIGTRIKNEYVTQFIDYRTILQEYHEVCINKNLKVKSNLIVCECEANCIAWDKGVRNKVSTQDYNAVIAKDNFHNLINEMTAHRAMEYTNVIRWVKSRRARSKKIWTQGLELKNELMATGTAELYSKIKTIPYSDLRATQDKINELIQKDEKSVIFVSGVPGAGKTLIGMITLFGSLGEQKKARYYTGNGALRNVLSNLMDTRDISMFTGFRKDYIENNNICSEQVLIFDEAQRLWDKNTNKLDITDAAGILSVSYKNNVSILCLIGNGQKPMSGEAGIEAWIETLKIDKTWKVYAPNQHKKEFIGVAANFYEDLYLDVAKRQHFVDLSSWVEAVLSADFETAKREFQAIEQNKKCEKFGILLTRSLEKLYKDNGARLIKHKQKREKESNSTYLFGLLCSSKNKMENMHNLTGGIIWQHFKKGQNTPQGNTYIENNKASWWYSGGCCDVSSIRVATETFCQGLEIDLPIIFFGGDYLIKLNKERYSVVITPSDFAKKRYGAEINAIMKDTYRILLTRATEEMILVVPETSDGRFDDTYEFFKKMGINEF